MASIKRGETKLYNLVAAYYKQPKVHDEGIHDDQEMEDTEMEDMQQEKQNTEFKIAIVGGRKNEDVDMA